MSTFLRTLIDRHQERTAGRESVHKVQPRPKARFENDTGSDTFASSTLETSSEFSVSRRSDTDVRPDKNRHDPSAESLLTTDIRQTARQAQDSVQPNNDKQAIASDYDPSLNELNSRIEAVTLMPGRQSYGRETSVGSDRHDVKPLETNEATYEPRSRFNNLRLSANEDINERIQEILQRSHGRQREAAEGNAILPGNNSQLPVMTEPLDQSAANENNTQGIRARSEQEEIHHGGQLQTPDWLNEIRADFNERRLAINGKAKTEPIVNVTIGRIEVKALPADSVKQSKVRANKPSGVMSLDDYLKLRERRS